MAAALHRILVAIMCIGITLSAVDALGLLCEYECASEIENAHGHPAGVGSSSHAELDRHHRHHHLSTSEFEFAVGALHRDADCSSTRALIIATGPAPDVPSADGAGISLALLESSCAPSDGHFAVALYGSPPLASNSSIPAASISLRI